MSFENRGKARRPDIRMTAKNKETGQVQTLGAAWINDGETRPGLRIDKDLAGILPVSREVLDRVIDAADGGNGLAAFVLDNIITTGKDGAHYVNIYLNWMEEQRVHEPKPEGISDADFDDDFVNELAGI